MDNGPDQNLKKGVLCNESSLSVEILQIHSKFSTPAPYKNYRVDTIGIG